MEKNTEQQATGEDGGGEGQAEAVEAPEERQGTKMKKKLLSCALSRRNSFPCDMEDGSAANSAGRVALQDGEADRDSIAKDCRKVRLEPLLDEDASGPPSELYETDSSNDHGSFINPNDNNSSSSSEKLLGAGQGQDIVAGSPSKVPDVAATQNDNEEQQAEKESANQTDAEKGREEMGGVIVYDSYAKLTGCTKIVDYFASQERRKVDTRILFSQQEAKALQKTLFFEKARERDFACDYDRHLWRNLPRFQTQRDFTNPQFSIHVPQQQNVLIFDSRFENGNLRKAAKINNVDYNLWLENDLNTKGHTQWYYFKVVYKDIAVRADKKTHTIRFNVLNLAKTTSLYQVGMKPCIWSRRRFEEEGVGWFRGGEEVTYAQNNILRETDFTADHQKMQADENNNNAFLYNNNGAGEGVDTYFTLSFKYAFVPNQDDEVWFAHAIPSTYTQLQEGLLKVRQSPEYEPFLRMNMLCQSLAKTPVPLLTITENVDTYLDYDEEIKLQTHLSGIVKKSFKQKYNNTKKLAKQSQQTRGQVKALLDRAIEEELRQFFEYNEDQFIQASPSFQGFGQRLINYVKIHSQKKAVVITSRVHPGEPQASHMVNGLIAYLLSPKASELRRHFVFRIVPMLNPDGVIYGNYRCSLLGCDLNRKWDKPNRYLHPSIYYAKNIVRHMHQERKVLLFCDLHGHSRKQNAFFYGCCYKNYEHEGRIKNARLRIIPLMCCQKNELFKLKGCRFRLERGREATARVAIFKEFNIMNSFTLECSFFGKEHSHQKKPTGRSDPFAVLQQQTRKLEHMSQADYESLGETLMKTMHSYLPGEQHLLEFVSGRILDVFYDEFVKFIPPFMLKREREKREQAEEEARKEHGKRQEAAGGSAARSSVKPNVLNKLATSDLGGQLLTMPPGQNSTQRSLQRQKTLNVTQPMTGAGQGGNASALQGSPQHRVNRRHSKKPVNTNLVGIQEVSGGSSSKAGGALSQFRTSQEYNGQEDNPQQAEQLSGRPNNANPSAHLNYKDSSSDQQAQNMFLSGNDTDNTNQGQGGRAGAAFHSNKEEMLEFETFFDNIQQKMKRKEMVKAQRAQLKDGEIPIEELELSEEEDSGTSSDDQTYKERARRPKKKKKKQQPGNYGKGQRTAQRKKEARDDAQPGAGGVARQRTLHPAANRDTVGVKNKAHSQTAAALAGTNRRARSPRHQQIDTLAPILGSKKAHDKVTSQPQKQEETQPPAQQPSEKQGSSAVATADRSVISGCDLTDVRTSELQPCPAEAILRSSEIQGLIKSQLSTGVLNQHEIMQVIQRAILKNQALAQLRAQQNKNRLLVNHPQSDGMLDGAKAIEEQNQQSTDKKKPQQPPKHRLEQDRLLRPLRIATSDLPGPQLGAQPQPTSPLYPMNNRHPGSNNFIGSGVVQARQESLYGPAGGALANLQRPSDESKESPLLPQQMRQGKNQGTGGNLRQNQSGSFQQQNNFTGQISNNAPQIVPGNQIIYQGQQVNGQNGGGQTEVQLPSRASRDQRGPKSQLSQHIIPEYASHTAAYSPQIRDIKGQRSELETAIEGYNHHGQTQDPTHTLKVEKTKKLQILGRLGGQAAISSHVEFNNLMLQNMTDQREQSKVVDSQNAQQMRIDSISHEQIQTKIQIDDSQLQHKKHLQRLVSDQVALDRVNVENKLLTEENDTMKNGMQPLEVSHDPTQGDHFRNRYQNSKLRRSHCDQQVIGKMKESDANGVGSKIHENFDHQRWTTDDKIKDELQNQGFQPAAHRSPSIISPEPESAQSLPVGMSKDQKDDLIRHDLSQPVINSRHPVQHDANGSVRSEHEKKLLQYGGWAMSGYTTMPAKSQQAPVEYIDNRLAASNNALGKILETEPLGFSAQTEIESSHKKSMEHMHSSSAHVKESEAAYIDNMNALNSGIRPRPNLKINAQMNPAKTNQSIGMSPGALGAGGLASVGIARSGGVQYNNLSQYSQSITGNHDSNNTDMLHQGQSVNHYAPMAQQQLYSQSAGKHTNNLQQSLRQSPTAASAGSTIIGNQRRNQRQNVMQDLRDQIAHESAALEMLNKQKQLQLQLERQEQLLHQLQNQLISHQLNAPGNGSEGAEPGTGSGKSGQIDDYQSSLMQIGSVISGSKARVRPAGGADARQLSMLVGEPGSATLHASPVKALGRQGGGVRGAHAPRMHPNDLGQLIGGPDTLSVAHARVKRNQNVADDAIAAALTRSVATDALISKHAGQMGADLASSRYKNSRPAASGPTGAGSVAQAAGSLLMQGTPAQQVRGASTCGQAFHQPADIDPSQNAHAANPYFARANTKGSSAPDRLKMMAGPYEGGLRQSQTKRSLVMPDGRGPQASLQAHQEAGFRLSHALQSQQVPNSGVISPPGNEGASHFGDQKTKAAQALDQFSPLTNQTLRFNAQGRVNIENQKQQPGRVALYNPGQPALGPPTLNRQGHAGLPGMTASASADRRPRQVPGHGAEYPDVNAQGAEGSPAGLQAAGFQPGRNASNNFARPSHAHSAVKQGGHLSINPLMNQQNRTGQFDNRVGGLTASRGDDTANGANVVKPHANIFASIDEYKPPHTHKAGAHMSDQKRPVIKKDNILFSGGASVPTFSTKQPASQGPQVPAMIINGVARRPSDNHVTRGRQGGSNN